MKQHGFNLRFTTPRVNSASDKLLIFVILFFTENRLRGQFV